MAAEVGVVVEEDGAWAEETALTPAASATSTDTAAATNREFESDLRVGDATPAAAELLTVVERERPRRPWVPPTLTVGCCQLR